MNWPVLVAGIAGVLIAGLLQAYLRVRIRQLRYAAETIHDFGQLSVALMDRDLPEEARENLVKLSKIVGTGRLANRLLRQLFRGEMDMSTLRSQVTARREIWSDYSRETRIDFTRAIFTAVLADSYCAGLVGTTLRRALFFVKSSPAEIALAIDAMETKILIMRTLEAGKAAEKDHHMKGAITHALRA